MIAKIKNLLRTSIGPTWSPWLVFFISLLAYLRTMAPTIGPIDSGELSLVCRTLGIAHPTGYPLYTLIGRLWVWLLPFGELAWKLNLLSAIFISFSVFFLYLALRNLYISNMASFSAALIYAFSPVVWQQSAFLEVYALTAMLATSLLWLVVKFHKDHNIRHFLLGSFIAGLGLGNHLSLLWLLPGFLILSYLKPERPGLKLTLLGVLFFATGLSIYLFLPIRSTLSPLFDWGNPSNWERFLGHISGKQYRGWMFNGSSGELWTNILRFMGTWLSNPPIYSWWLIIPGVGLLFRKNKGLLVSLLAVMILTVFYAVNYSIPDIEAYYIPAFICSSIFLAFGLDWLLSLKRFLPVSYKIRLVFPALAVALFVIPLGYGLKTNDNSRNRISYIVASGVLESAAPNGVILADNWDIYSPCLYLMHYREIRRDVILIDKELLRRRWYFGYLEKQYPEYYDSCRKQIDSFLKALYPFEHGLPYDPNVIQQAYVELLNAMLLNNYYDNPPYLTQNRMQGDLANVAQGYNRVPEGFLFRLKTATAIESVEDGFLFSGQALSCDTLKLSQREMMLYRLLPQMLYQRGVYYAQNLMFNQALEYFLQALKYESKKANLYLALGGTYFGLNRTAEARDAFQKALGLDPGNQVALENLKRLSIFLPGGPKAITTELNSGN